jgi:hypothetical protein
MFIATPTKCDSEHNHHSVTAVFRNRNTVAFTLQTGDRFPEMLLPTH